MRQLKTRPTEVDPVMAPTRDAIQASAGRMRDRLTWVLLGGVVVAGAWVTFIEVVVRQR